MNNLDKLLERADRKLALGWLSGGDMEWHGLCDSLAQAVRELREELHRVVGATGISPEGRSVVGTVREAIARERAESATLRARLDGICPQCASGLCSAHQPGTKGVEAFARLNRKLTDDLARERKLHSDFRAQVERERKDSHNVQLAYLKELDRKRADAVQRAEQAEARYEKARTDLVVAEGKLLTMRRQQQENNE